MTTKLARVGLREQPILILLCVVRWRFRDGTETCERPHCHAEPSCKAVVLYAGQIVTLDLCDAHGEEVVRRIADDTTRTRSMKGNANASWIPPVPAQAELGES